MELRQLTMADEREIQRVIHAAFAAEPWNDCWQEDEVFHHYVEDLVDNQNSLALGLEDGGELAGLALGRLKHWFDGVEYCVDDLCVMPGRQGKGIGSELLRQMEAYGRRHGIARITLRTDRTAPAYQFYRKNGFQELAHKVCLTLSCEPVR